MPADIGYVSTGSQARTNWGATGSRSTTRRSVTTRTSSAMTGTATSCSWGKTSRNQPTEPARASTTPRTVTDTLVSRPANIKANPQAKARGHAVDAGTSISLETRGPGATCSADPIATSPLYRPITYTTVKTTTHTASTKCQYMESVSIRADCSRPKLPARPNSSTTLSMIRPTVTWEACSPTSE